MADFFSHPVFMEAISDIESLGVRVSQHKSLGAKPYVVVGGRSNARWWLIPLESGRVTASGLALFQPLLASARYMKTAASILSFLGLNRLWVWHRVYIAGEPCLARYFQTTESLSFAYFTGTDSPHRKVAVQIMDGRGNLKGFAKLTRNPQVRTLMANEAATLKHLQGLKLQTAYVPQVLYSGEHGDSTLLVTDTLKTPRTPSTTRFSAAHRAFVQELARKTALPHRVCVSDMARDFRAQFNRIHLCLEKTWCQRLDEVIRTLEAKTDIQLSACLSHGDFTPWNTFMSNGLLYVFDWEYADQVSLISNDIIHFVLNEPQTRRQPVGMKIKAALKYLSQSWTGIQRQTVYTLLIIYLLTQSLRQIERLPDTLKHKQDWDGAAENAAMIDKLLVNDTAIHA